MCFGVTKHFACGLAPPNITWYSAGWGWSSLTQEKRKKLKRWLLTFWALLHEKGKTQALFWPFALQYKTHENDEILKTPHYTVLS